MLESELYDREFDDHAKGGRGAGDVNPGVPAAVFQPPPVVFQPPQVRQEAQQAGASRSRGARDSESRRSAGGNGAGPGSDAEDARAEGGATSDAVISDAGAADGADSAEEADGRRRRRRPTRSRTRTGGSEDAAGETADAAAAEGTVAADGPGQPEPQRTRTTGRTRSRKASPETSDDAAPAAEEADSGVSEPADNGGTESDDDGLAGPGGSARRRRRKRRRGGADGTEALAADDPPDTVVHVREPVAADDVRAVKGSTRLEAKKQRRREGRETGRRRPPIITESEFLARRESVERTMVVRQRDDRTQIAVLEDGVLVEHYVNRSTHQSYVGNVYLGKVQNVLPSMEAAFVDIGKGRNAVLYAGEVNFDVSGLEGQPKRIESALKAGQSLIVQVTKDPVGHKGARLTSQVSLPGRYLVYVPGASMTGISRKLPDTERNRLKQILKKVMPENAGVIVRTAAEGAAEEELSRDVARLAAQWEAIEKKSKTASAPALLYSEPDLTIRVIRDVFNEDFNTLVVAGEQGWDTVDEYVKYVAPHLADRLSRWQPDEPAEDVFAEYRIDEQLAKALERKVWLPSGGSLVIDKTEAMTVIDVNTGKFTGQGGNLEETVTRNNLEAAEEIVRQLRLRDVGGIVVIDFIDMVLESNRELVLRRLLECLARDRTKHQVAEVTSLGLVQMTRKRVGAGLLEAFSQPCECCNGRGVILTYEADVEGRAIHVHPRPVDTGAPSGGSGAASGGGANGSGGQGGNGGNGGGSGNGSGGRTSSGGRTRRGSRNRGGSAAASPAASPAAVAAATVAPQTQPADAQRAAGEPEAGQGSHGSPHGSTPGAEPASGGTAATEPASGAVVGQAQAEAAQPREAQPAAALPAAALPGEAQPGEAQPGEAQAEPARTSNGRRRRRKPAASSVAQEAAPQEAAPQAEDGAA